MSNRLEYRASRSEGAEHVEQPRVPSFSKRRSRSCRTAPSAELPEAKKPGMSNRPKVPSFRKGAKEPRMLNCPGVPSFKKRRSRVPSFRSKGSEHAALPQGAEL